MESHIVIYRNFLGVWEEIDAKPRIQEENDIFHFTTSDSC